MSRAGLAGNVRGEMAVADLDLIRRHRSEILDRASEHGARNVRVFGSAARGDAGPTSDLDLLVEMEAGRSLLDFVGLWQELEDLLGLNVDLALVWDVVEPALPALRRKIAALIDDVTD